MEQKEKKRRCDPILLTIIMILVVIGLVLLQSTSAYNGQVKFHDSFYYLKKQGFATVLGLLGMYVVSKIDYHVWKKFVWIGYGVSILLLIAVLLVGDEYNGSKRWLSFGPVSFQPSEFAKVAMILFLAFYVGKHVKDMKKIFQMI